MALPNQNGVIVHNGKVCSPLVVPTATSIPYGDSNVGSVLDSLNTVTNTSITAGTCIIKFYKCGKVVFVSCMEGSLNVTSNTSIGTVPQGYRPIANVDFTLGNPTKRMIISPDGRILPMFTETNSALRFSTTYITN